MNKNTKTALIVASSILVIGIGTDWFSGTSKSYKGEVIDKDKTYNTRTNDDGRTTSSVSYYVYVSSDQNQGMPETISVSHGKYRSALIGKEVTVEKSIGGFTGITYSKTIR